MRRIVLCTFAILATLGAVAPAQAATADPARAAAHHGRLAAATSYAGVTINDVAVGGVNAPTVFAAPGSTVAVHVAYVIQDTACPGCIDQIEVGWAAAQPSGCVYDGIPGPSGVTSSGTANLTVPYAPGLYYIGFDRSQHYSCAQAIGTGAWWNSPPDSGRYLAAVAVYPPTTMPPTIRNVTLRGVALNSGGNTAFVAPRSTVRVGANYAISDPGCPGCIDQIEVGFSDRAPRKCLYNGVPGSAGARGTAAITLAAPATAGVYFVGYDRAQHYSCAQAIDTGHWWNSPPDAFRIVAAVAVQPYALP
jgi:hypothetical protein